MLYDHTIKPAPVTKPRCCDAEAGVFTRGAVGITPGGRECVLSAGPPCGSFVFLNSYTSGRSKDRPLGNARSRPYVKVANRILAHGWLN